MKDALELPTSVVGMAKHHAGGHFAYVNIRWRGGGLVISGYGRTEILAVKDLIRRLKDMGKCA